MTSKSIFSYLKGYIPTENRDPKEDYLTQMLAAILQKYPTISEKYTEFLFCKAGKCNFDFSNKVINVYTQKTVMNGRIDLFLEIENKIGLICEHKVMSELSDNQINKYMECKSELNVKECYSVLITLYSSQHTQDADVRLTWADIYDFMGKLRQGYDDNSVELFLINEFMIYLKDEGLAGGGDINLRVLTDWFRINELENNLTAMFKSLELTSEEWNSICPALKKFPIVSGSFEPSCKKHYGRMGIEFFSEWNLGLFVGVILDPRDHKLEPNDINNGPDFVVLIDYDFNKYGKMDNPNFAFVEERKIIIEKIYRKYGYDFISNPLNKWRKIILRKPLAEVIEDKITKDEQRTAILNEIKNGLNLLIEAED